MLHKHQFVYVGEASKVVGPSLQPRSLVGSTYVCLDPECGEVRRVFPDGDVKVAKEGLPEKEL